MGARPGLLCMAMVWPCSTHIAIEHTHTTDKAKSSTYNPLRHKGGFEVARKATELLGCLHRR